MVQKRGKYEDEFKREAVRLADESEKSAAQIARDLGIHRNLRYKWRKELREGGLDAFPGQGKLKASDEEMRHFVSRSRADVLSGSYSTY